MLVEEMIGYSSRLIVPKKLPFQHQPDMFHNAGLASKISMGVFLTSKIVKMKARRR